MEALRAGSPFATYSQIIWLEWTVPMSHASWPLHDAKNRLSTVIEAACRGEAQLVTRHNRPVAVVLAVEEYRRLKALEERIVPSFAEQLLALPQDDEPFPRLELEPRSVGL